MKHSAIKEYGRVGNFMAITTLLLTKELYYSWSRSLCGPRAGLDALEERELLPLLEIKP
jgi:hypothetical protein